MYDSPASLYGPSAGPSLLAQVGGEALVIVGITAVSFTYMSKYAVSAGERIGPEFLAAEDGSIPWYGDYRLLAGAAIFAANALNLTDKLGQVPVVGRYLPQVVDLVGFGSLVAYGVNEAQRAADAGVLPIVGTETPKFLTAGA